MRHLKWIIMMGLLTSVVQCGKESGISRKITFQVDPKSPVVINSDLTLDRGLATERLVAAPWFQFGYSGANNSDQTITIQSLTFKISYFSADGVSGSSEASLDPGDFTPPQTYLAEVAPGTTYEGRGIYLHSLPDDAVNFTYSITVEIQGWVGDSTHPTDRLSKTYSFMTR